MAAFSARYAAVAACHVKALTKKTPKKWRDKKKSQLQCGHTAGSQHMLSCFHSNNPTAAFTATLI